MKITFLGHATLFIKTTKALILVDPFISGNDLAKNKINIADIKPDFILLTHAHQDHVLDVEAIAQQSNATIVSNYEITTFYEKKGFKVHPMNHGGNWNFNFGSLKYVNAIHTSSFADGTYGGQPGGFILSADDKNVYIAGDTALTYDMQLIPMTFTLDLAILPIGDNFTMGVDDAIIASDFVGCDVVLGYHFDTFGYIKIDHTQAKQKFEEADKKLYLLDVGKSIIL